MFPEWYKFKNPPRPHQKILLDKLYGNNEMAMFMWMGRGKTFSAINITCALHMEGKVNAGLVICPSGVKPVWPMEWEEHSPIPADSYIMEPGYIGFKDFLTRDSPFKLLIVGVEALSQGKAHEFVELFCKTHDVICMVDESTSIKNPWRPKSKQKGWRTKRTWDIGGLCLYRIIMTGTEVTEGIENLYSQYRFLNWKILGHKSYYTFRSRHCIMGGFENRKIIEYVGIDEIMENVYPYTFSIGKDVKGLPPKIYEKPIVVKPSKEQKKAFDELKLFESTDIGDKELLIENTLERDTRYQQICGGFLPYNAEDGQKLDYKERGILPVPGTNPKLQALINLLEDTSENQQVIIWAKFVPEVDIIYQALSKKYSVDMYIGGSTTQERIEKIKKFQRGETRILIANKTMALGVTVTAASLVIYYSNEFSYEIRIQSEERAHRDGQKNTVTYVDIVMDHPMEKRLQKSIARKADLAEYVKREMGAYKLD